MKTENYKSITQKIVNTIVKSVHPEKVILFGSRAKGNYGKDSDYDFMINWMTTKKIHTLFIPGP